MRFQFLVKVSTVAANKDCVLWRSSQFFKLNIRVEVAKIRSFSLSLFYDGTTKNIRQFVRRALQSGANIQNCLTAPYPKIEVKLME